MALKLDEFLGAVISIGGEEAPLELANARLEICRGCEYRVFSKLTPISEEKERCSKCKCPLDKKPFILSNRKKLSILNRLERTTCPHPDGNQWEGVDIDILGILKVNQLNRL